MKKPKLAFLLMVVLSMMLASSIRLAAQTARITGEVTDPAGKVVPGAAVLVKNEATGVERNTQTTNAGVYSVAALPSGQYTVQVKKAGFDTNERTGVTLTVDTATQFNFQLSVQRASSEVVVNADASMVQANNPELATTVTGKEVTDLALIQVDRYRNPTNFLYLAPATQGNYAPSGATNTATTNYIDVHGGQTQQVEIYLEGLAAGQMRTVGSFTDQSPPVDAIQEFKFTTAFVGAQYGHTGDAVAIFTVRSGTNALHGSVYEYFRNQFLNANPYGAAVGPQTHQNEFGVTLGGPIVIPHIYNGHDRSFFFFSYGGSRKSGADNLQNVTIPTLAERTGNFSADTTKIYDPETTTMEADGSYTRTQFPGNIIPANRIDPVAAAIIKYYPAPNTGGPGTSHATYQTWSGEQKLNPNVYTVKLDHVINNSNRISYTYVFTNNPRLLISDGLPEPIWDVSDQTTTGTNTRLNYDWTISPNLLNIAVVGLNRYTNLDLPPEPNTNWPASLGLSGVNGGLFPEISFSATYTALGEPEEAYHVENTYQARDVLMWNVAAHTLQFGGEFRHVQFNDRAPNPANSAFDANALETNEASSTSGGDPFASFLVGAIDAASLQEPFLLLTRYNYAGFFVQDDWRAASRLTLNSGIRWEFQTPPVEKNNHSSMISLTTPNPGAGELPGALVFAHPGNRAFVQNDYGGLSGRFGLAYQLTARNAFRAGYGLYYTDTGETLYDAGFQPQAVVETPNNGITPALYLKNGFPSSASLTVTQSPTLQNGQTGVYVGRYAGAMPRIQEWTASVEQQLSANWLLTLSYVGNHATRLVNPDMVNINQDNPAYLSLGAVLSDQVGSAAANAAGVTAPYPGFTGDVAQALRPYPQYLGLTSQGAKAGESSYNGLEIVLRHRYNNGLTLGAFYSWSKVLGYGNPSLYGGSSTNNVLQNYYDTAPQRSLLPIDTRNSVTLYYTYEFPFGSGRTWLNHGGFTNAFLGGWEFSAIQKYQSGFPLEIYRTNTLPIFNSVLRPNIVPGENPAAHIPVGQFTISSTSIINKAAFAAPAAYSFGDARPAYDGLTQYSILNEDLAAIKQFQVKNGVAWIWYGQFFNAFNRHRFTGVTTNQSDSTFGEASGVSDPRRIQIGTRILF